MATRTFDISESEELAKYIKGCTEAGAKRAVLSAAMRVVQRITTDIIPALPRPPVDRGAYRAGWHARALPKGAEISNSMPYASVIEYGARPEHIKIGRAMIEALTGWVKRKGIVKGRGKDADAEATSMAWAIAIAMKKKGIYNGGKGLRVLEKALKHLPRILKEEFKREMGNFHE